MNDSSFGRAHAYCLAEGADWRLTLTVAGLFGYLVNTADLNFYEKLLTE